MEISYFDSDKEIDGGLKMMDISKSTNVELKILNRAMHVLAGCKMSREENVELDRMIDNVLKEITKRIESREF